MPTEQSMFVTKREVENLKCTYDYDDPEYIALSTLQHAITLLGEECNPHYPERHSKHTCLICKRKSALLQKWNSNKKKEVT